MPNFNLSKVQLKGSCRDRRYDCRHIFQSLQGAIKRAQKLVRSDRKLGFQSLQGAIKSVRHSCDLLVKAYFNLSKVQLKA